MKKEKFYVQTRIFEMGLCNSELSVYFYLCNCADIKGICFPGRKKICNATGLSLATVSRAIKGLAVKKVIMYSKQFRLTQNGNARQTSNKYIILNLEESEVENTNEANKV